MSATLAFTLRMEMLSDWAIGSGSGRQRSIDSLVARDVDDLPFVPAKTLRGMWRDAAEQVAFGLDGGVRHGAWAKVVTHLFGSQPAIERLGAASEAPIPARLSVSDARFPLSVRDCVAGQRRHALREAFAFVKPGVKIDPRSGRAQADFLRFEEVARRGAVLEAPCSIALTGGEADAALTAFCFAATRLLEYIGGDRRRGLGQCKVSIDAANAPGGLPKSDAEAVEALAGPAPNVESDVASPPGFAFRAAEPGRRFEIVELSIELLAPTVIADDVLGNVVTTLDYIPGSLLLPAVMPMLASLGLGDTEIRQAFSAGDLRVLPAYPEVAGKRGLPMPLDIEKLKSKPPQTNPPKFRRVLDDDRNDDSRFQYKAERGGYVAISEDGGDQNGADLHLVRARLRPSLRTHNAVDDDHQRPMEIAGGGVYVYQALPAGMRLRSELWMREGLAAGGDIGPNETFAASVGRARRAGYGEMRVKPGVRRPLPGNPIASVDEAILYFESDALLPTALAASPAAFIVQTLEGLGASGVVAHGGAVRTRRTDGWIARWGLPRASFVAIEAGSVVKVSGTNLAKALATLAVEGLGARRGEGFGRVLVNDKVGTARIVSIEDEDAAARKGAGSGEPIVQGAARKFLETIEFEAIAATIRLKAEIAAGNAQRRKQNLDWTEKEPGMSQLGSLRSVMNWLADDGDRARALDFLKNLENTDRAGRWGEGEDSRKPIGKLKELFADHKKIWDVLRFGESALQDICAVSSPDQILGGTRYQDLALASFLAAAMRAHKRDLEKAPEQQPAEET